MESVKERVQWTLSGNATVVRENARRTAEGGKVVLFRRPSSRQVTHSARRINALHSRMRGARRYLEIGVFAGETLQNVRAAERTGVDPAPRFDVQRLPHGVHFFSQTSDDYFSQLSPTAEFDLAFIDGLHTFEQTYRDVINTLAHVLKGPILIDDTVPDSAATALPDLDEALATAAAQGDLSGRWHGDVWKVVVALDRFHPEIEFRTITGEDNPQTLIWRRDENQALATVSADDVRSVGTLTYDEMFTERVPRVFRPANEADAIAWCLDVVAPRF